MSNDAAGPPANELELYEKLIAAHPGAERKGATMPYTSRNGHMFSFLTKSGRMALRLPTEERTTFLKRYKSQLCEQHGIVMKEYVEVPDSLLKKTTELMKYFDVSYAFVGSLKPKPTKKEKKTARKKTVKAKTSRRPVAKKKKK